MNLIMKKDCKANKDDKMDCDDDCNGGLDCKNKKITKVPMEKEKTGKCPRLAPPSILPASL
jgi:hypothetical protein